MPLYRLLAEAIFALYGLRLRLAGRGAALAERLGRGPARRDAAPLLWIHGASNGELASARAVIAALLARAPALRILVTANSETGRALVGGWDHPRIDTALAPFDLGRAVRAVLSRWRPAALIVLENELWPERILTCARHGVPVFVLGARLSDRSFRLWRRLPGLARRLLAAVRFLAAQDAASEARFRALGVAAGRIGPIVNLKSAAAAGRATETLPFPRALTLLAASTHDGEEAVVLDAFRRARAALPGLRLILAPRHPRRRDAVEALIRATGLGAATRSRGEAADEATVVYLADTLGEMDLWYAAAGMTFVGGSLVDRGGHTPFEPAAHRSALLHGPHTANSAPAYAALREAAASVEVRDAGDLAAAIAALADAERQAAMAARAAGALAALGGGGGLAAFYADLARATGLAELAG